MTADGESNVAGGLLSPRASEVMKWLDHSLLKPTLTTRELEAGCEEGRELGVASVCVLPHFIERAVRLLTGSATLPSTVLAFPHGSLPLGAKLGELAFALDAGAREVDAVVNLSLLKSHDFSGVEAEVAELTRETQRRGARIKVIFETCVLDEFEIRTLAGISGRVGVDWVKTSTGFGAQGATPEAVRLLREASPAQVQVKASGGIRTLGAVLEYRRLGATRIGTSVAREIFEEAQRLGGEPAASR